MGELWSHPAHDGANTKEDAPTGTVKLVVAPKDSDERQRRRSDGAAGNGSDDATEEFFVEARFLCAVSPVFRTMLEGECVEARTRTVEAMQGATGEDIACAAQSISTCTPPCALELS